MKHALPLIVTAGRGSLHNALRLKNILPEALLATPHTNPSDTIGDMHYESLASFLPASFLAGHPLIWIGAAAIPIRLLGPFLHDKTDEPPLIVLNDSLSHVIPLLGLHHGGYRLGQRIADALDIPNVTTSRSENRLGLALDDPPEGWVLANPQHYRSFAARLTAEETPVITGSIPWLEGVFNPNITGSPTIKEARQTKGHDNTKDNTKDSELHIIASVQQHQGTPDRLHYIPRNLALGIGCSRGAESQELIDLAKKVLEENHWDERAIAGIFSIDLKIDEKAVHDVADFFHVPARFFTARRLKKESERVPHPSQTVLAATGTPSVAESAALIAAGADGTLVVDKQRTDHATIAVGQSHHPIDPSLYGQARGQLDIIGLGPGTKDMLSFQAHQALLEAEDIIGYDAYLKAIDPRMTRAKKLHSFELGQEAERARLALNLAARGKRIALVSSGDPSIYAMACVVFETLEREHNQRWRKVAIRVIPGISALQAASATTGALISHDFCVLSLSDLRTDFALIQKRLIAAVEADFIIALYNPLSQTRRRPFAEALRILQSRRQADTPVLIVRHAGRENQHVRIIHLGALSDKGIDMHSIILIGSHASRQWKEDNGKIWLYTPRSGVPRDET